MATLRTKPPRIAIDPALIATVQDWSPKGASRPVVEIEPRVDGLRVKLTYLAVESGVVFRWDSWNNASNVHSTLDRVFDVLSWRVMRPAARATGAGAVTEMS